MTTRQFDRMTFTLLAGLVLVLGAIAYGVRPRSSAAAETTATGDTAGRHLHAATADVPEREAGTFSLGDLTATWRDQAGIARPLLGADDGRLAVVTMAYTNCTVSCPRLIADLKRIEGALTGAQRARVEFVMVSLDPARDTPARLAGFARGLHLDPAAWTLLTGSADDVRELAAALGVRYVMEANGEVSHTNRIVVLDAAGTPVHWQAGLGSGVEGTVAAIKGMLSR
jgi:protein SCO1/2